MEGDLSLVTRLFEFAGALGSIWFAFVTGVVLVIEQLVEAIFPGLFEKVDKRWRKPDRQRAVRWLILFSVLYTSFQAYDEVSKKLRDTQQELNRTKKELEGTEKRSSITSASTSRLAVTTLGYAGAIGGPIHINVINQGAMPAYMRFSAVVGNFRKNLTPDDINSKLSELEDIARRSLKSPNLGDEISSGYNISPQILQTTDITKPLIPSKEEYEKLSSEKGHLNVFAVFIYDDEALGPNQVRYNKFSATFLSDGRRLMHPGQNGTKVRTLPF